MRCFLYDMKRIVYYSGIEAMRPQRKQRCRVLQSDAIRQERSVWSRPSGVNEPETATTHDLPQCRAPLKPPKPYSHLSHAATKCTSASLTTDAIRSRGFTPEIRKKLSNLDRVSLTLVSPPTLMLSIHLYKFMDALCIQSVFRGTATYMPYPVLGECFRLGYLFIILVLSLYVKLEHQRPRYSWHRAAFALEAYKVATA